MSPDFETLESAVDCAVDALDTAVLALAKAPFAFMTNDDGTDNKELANMSVDLLKKELPAESVKKLEKIVDEEFEYKLVNRTSIASLNIEVPIEGEIENDGYSDVYVLLFTPRSIERMSPEVKVLVEKALEKNNLQLDLVVEQGHVVYAVDDAATTTCSSLFVPFIRREA